jgi:hypothetical protein
MVVDLVTRAGYRTRSTYCKAMIGLALNNDVRNTSVIYFPLMIFWLYLALL